MCKCSRQFPAEMRACDRIRSCRPWTGRCGKVHKRVLVILSERDYGGITVGVGKTSEGIIGLLSELRAMKHEASSNRYEVAKTSEDCTMSSGDPEVPCYSQRSPTQKRTQEAKQVEDGKVHPSSPVVFCFSLPFYFHPLLENKKFLINQCAPSRLLFSTHISSFFHTFSRRRDVLARSGSRRGIDFG